VEEKSYTLSSTSILYLCSLTVWKHLCILESLKETLTLCDLPFYQRRPADLTVFSVRESSGE